VNVVRKFRIAVVPGDGIGNEVVPEGLRVLDQLAPDLGSRATTRQVGDAVLALLGD
jgi:tartrate dehydrogenase/decarboxylase / D-malate dehydrogenase